MNGQGATRPLGTATASAVERTEGLNCAIGDCYVPWRDRLRPLHGDASLACATAGRIVRIGPTEPA